jgi:hypothetical protein
MEQDFDDIFRERLMRAETPPPNAVWENIALELARKKRRRLVGFGLAGGAAMVSLAVAAWFYFGENLSVFNNDKNLATASESIVSKNEILELKSQVLVLKNEILDLEKAVSGTNKEVWDSKNEAAPNYLKKNGTSLTENLTNQAPSLIQKMESENKSSAPDFAEKALILNQKTTKIGQENEKQLTTAFFEKTRFQNSSNGANQTQLIENQSIVTIEDSELTTYNNLKKVNLAKLFSENKPLFVKSQKATRQLPPYKMTRIKKRKPTCPSFAARGEAFMLEGFAGPALAIKTLASSDDTQNYLQNRRETESNRASWKAGLRAGWLIDGKFLLRAGINYTAINERFNYYDPNEVDTFISIVQGVRDTDIVYGERFVNAPNRFGMLDLPITIGYEFGRGPLGVDIFGGAAVNLWFHKSGKSVDLKNEPVNLRPNFRTNAGLSLLFGAQFFYQTNKKSRIFIEPHYQQVLRSVTQSSNPISQKYGVASLAVGFTRLMK